MHREEHVSITYLKVEVKDKPKFAQKPQPKLLLWELSIPVLGPKSYGNPRASEIN